MSIINFHVCYTCCNNIIPTFLYIEDTLLEGCTNNNQLYDNVLSYIKKNIHPSFYYCHRCCQGLDSYLYFSNICYNNMNLDEFSSEPISSNKIIKCDTIRIPQYYHIGYTYRCENCGRSYHDSIEWVSNDGIDIPFDCLGKIDIKLLSKKILKENILICESCNHVHNFAIEEVFFLEDNINTYSEDLLVQPNLNNKCKNISFVPKRIIQYCLDIKVKNKARNSWFSNFAPRKYILGMSTKNNQIDSFSYTSYILESGMRIKRHSISQSFVTNQANSIYHCDAYEIINGKKYIRENFDVKIHQNLLIEVYMHSVTECIMKDLNIGNISPIADFSNIALEEFEALYKYISKITSIRKKEKADNYYWRLIKIIFDIIGQEYYPSLTYKIISPSMIESKDAFINQDLILKYLESRADTLALFLFDYYTDFSYIDEEIRSDLMNVLAILYIIDSFKYSPIYMKLVD